MTNMINAKKLIRYSYQDNDEKSKYIDLKELFVLMWKSKFLGVFCVLFFGIIGGIWSYYQPNIYSSTALVAPAEQGQDSSLSRIASQMSAVSSIAGINLNKSGVNNTDLAIQILQSRKFITMFIQRHHILPILMATTNWDKEKKKFKYNLRIYNPNTKKWKINSKGESYRPSIIKAADFFRNNILNVYQDNKNNMIYIKVKFISPIESKKWVLWLVDDINNQIRKNKREEAENSINYFEKMLRETSVAENRAMLYNLIEQQTKILMLTNIRKEYVFQMIDPPIEPYVHIAPKRKFIIILSGFIGLILFVLFILIKKLF